MAGVGRRARLRNRSLLRCFCLASTPSSLSLTLSSSGWLNFLTANKEIIVQLSGCAKGKVVRLGFFLPKLDGVLIALVEVSASRVFRIKSLLRHNLILEVLGQAIHEQAAARVLCLSSGLDELLR